ncbi:MAG: hemerythrin domain-containing protein [Deltaproteobacteria bacterium]|jgi:hemerythrin superfamily protein|nr:hemerythrin domain-containing protein [Deltaproteobacteria bacterium]
METVGTGLSDHLKRASDQIQAQHRRLEPLFEDLSRALAGGSSRDAQTAAFRLDGAVKAHFLLEEEVVFPAIRGLRPEHQAELETLVGDHEGLGVGLQTVIDQILKAQFDLASQSLESCRLAIRKHEMREEAFLSGLDSGESESTL